MAKLEWDKVGERFYETGVKNLALYVMDESGAYGNGVAWSGVTGITESPSGADKTALYADDIKYLSLTAAEDFGATIEAYSYPPEFEACDGSATLAPGITIGQQERKTFGLAYKTALGNDSMGNDYGYKLHLVYGCQANPSERSYATINESPEAITFSWEVSTTPVNVTGHKPTAHLEINSKKVAAEKLKKIEDKLFGTSTGEPTFMTPDEILAEIA